MAINYILFFLGWLIVQGPREIGVSYCVHNVTTAVLPSTSSMETLSSGHIMYTIGHTYIPKSWTTNLKNTVVPRSGQSSWFQCSRRLKVYVYYSGKSTVCASNHSHEANNNSTFLEI